MAVFDLEIYGTLNAYHCCECLYFFFIVCKNKVLFLVFWFFCCRICKLELLELTVLLFDYLINRQAFLKDLFELHHKEVTPDKLEDYTDAMVVNPTHELVRD